MQIKIKEMNQELSWLNEIIIINNVSVECKQRCK